MNSQINTPRKSQPWIARYANWTMIGIVASSTLAAAQVARAEDKGWYAGMNYGVSRSNFGGSNVDNALGNKGITSASSVDRSDRTYSFNLGYQFNKNFALEGGYTDFGNFKVNSSISSPATDTASGSWKASGWSAVGVGTLPLDNKFALYGKAGLIFADTKLNLASTGATSVSSASESSTNGTYGLGVSYDFGNRLIGKLEWNRYQDLGKAATTGSASLDTYTAGIAYRF